MERLFGALIIFSLVFLSSVTRAAPSCKTVEGTVNTCLTYLDDPTTGNPSGACCAETRAAAAQVTGKQDLVAVCNCLKTAFTQSGYRLVPSRISDLPIKCGVPIKMPAIDQNYDCSKISWNM